MSFWKDKKVLVTGGAGFIGSHLVELLVNEGARVRVMDNLETGTLDFLNEFRSLIEFVKGNAIDLQDCVRACRGMEVVMNLAAKVGGIGYNATHSGTMFYTNVMINSHMLEAARTEKVDRFLCVSSACVYPRHCTIPIPEEEGFREDPEPTNLGYGWAKRFAEVQARCYAEEFSMNVAIARPSNAYGPREDSDLETAHVIPALIRKVLERQDPVVVWGTGEQTRAFLYVTDFARGLMLNVEKYPVPDPINIGPGEEIRIRDLVDMVIRLTGCNARVVFDTSKPSGHPRRNSKTTKAETLLGYRSQVSLEEGLAKTIQWYQQFYF